MNEISEFVHGNRVFDNPFMLPSNEAMPTTFQSAMDVALFLYGMNPLYGQSTTRIVSHFLNDVNFPDKGSPAEKTALRSFLYDDLGLKLYMASMGKDWACYGNAYGRIHFPFDRYLIMPNGKAFSVDFFGEDLIYNHQTMKYRVKDPTQNGKQENVSFRDIPSTDTSRISLRLLNPRYITVIFNPFSGTKRFVYRFEPDVLQAIRKGRPQIVNETPMVMLESVKRNEDFLFAPDMVFHFMAPTVSGVTQGGIGLPGTLLNYRQLHQLQVYRKLDEAVGLDYMTPFRLFSPAVGMDSQSMQNTILNGRWRSEISAIIRNRRADKFAIHSVPFPINYQEVGAQGKELTPKDLMEFQTATFLDGLGYPQELFKGTLAYMQVPTAMRLFENSFNFIHINFDKLLRWVNRRTSEYLGRPVLPVELQLPSMVDNLERRQLMLQLSAMGEISRETAYDGLNVSNISGEMRKRMEEDANKARLQAKMEADMQRELATGAISATMADPNQQQGGPAGSLPGGPPGGNQGQPAITPGDTMAEAQQLAEYWMQLPEGQRTQAMMAQKAGKPELHALAKQLMEDMRSQGASQGRQAVNEQMAGGGQ